MNSHFEYNAPWGRSLKIMTGLSAVILVGIPVIGTFTGPHGSLFWILGMLVTPLSMLFIASLFSVRGYILTTDTLIIRRLIWNSRIALSGLKSAEVDTDAMSKSIRTFGNGGLFCFAGTFNNNRLGSYRAFATDPKRAVVLRFSDRTVVVTPDQPDDFVMRIRQICDKYLKPIGLQL